MKTKSPISCQALMWWVSSGLRELHNFFLLRIYYISLLRSIFEHVPGKIDIPRGAESHLEYSRYKLSLLSIRALIKNFVLLHLKSVFQYLYQWLPTHLCLMLLAGQVFAARSLIVVITTSSLLNVWAKNIVSTNYGWVAFIFLTVSLWANLQTARIISVLR